MINLFPDLYNFANVNLIDIIQIAASALLGIAAIMATIITAINANKLNKKSIKLNEQSVAISSAAIKHEIKMKELELNIALYPEINEVNNFFINEILKKNFLIFPTQIEA